MNPDSINIRDDIGFNGKENTEIQENLQTMLVLQVQITYGIVESKVEAKLIRQP